MTITHGRVRSATRGGTGSVKRQLGRELGLSKGVVRCALLRRRCSAPPCPARRQVVTATSSARRCHRAAAPVSQQCCGVIRGRLGRLPGFGSHRGEAKLNEQVSRSLPSSSGRNSDLSWQRLNMVCACMQRWHSRAVVALCGCACVREGARVCVVSKLSQGSTFRLLRWMNEAAGQRASFLFCFSIYFSFPFLFLISPLIPILVCMYMNTLSRWVH